MARRRIKKEVAKSRTENEVASKSIIGTRLPDELTLKQRILQTRSQSRTSETKTLASSQSPSSDSNSVPTSKHSTLPTRRRSKTNPSVSQVSSTPKNKRVKGSPKSGAANRRKKRQLPSRTAYPQNRRQPAVSVQCTMCGDSVPKSQSHQRGFTKYSILCLKCNEKVNEHELKNGVAASEAKRKAARKKAGKAEGDRAGATSSSVFTVGSGHTPKGWDYC